MINQILDSLFGPSSKAALLTALETAINGSLQYAPATRNHIQQMAGKTIELDLEAPAFKTFIVMEASGLRLQQYSEETSHLVIRGGPASVWKVLNSKAANPLMGSGLEVQGDIGLLQHLGDITKNLDFDWEAPIVDTLGPVLGHQLANILRVKLEWLKHAKDRAPEVVKDFIIEESQLVAHPEAVADFYKSIRDVRMQTDRLEARIQQLSSTVSSR